MKWRRNPDYVPDLVDSTEVRRHVAALVESGASLASIARTADLSNPTVYALMGDTPPRRVKITTARALLSVRAS
jgi:lambda repressor-like predicted transcriptional regulator